MINLLPTLSPFVSSDSDVGSRLAADSGSWESLDTKGVAQQIIELAPKDAVDNNDKIYDRYPHPPLNMGGDI